MITFAILCVLLLSTTSVVPWSLRPSSNQPPVARIQSRLEQTAGAGGSREASNPVLWRPGEALARESAMRKFQDAVGVSGGYEELWKWSIEHSDCFWKQLMLHLELDFEGSLEPARQGTEMPDVTYFPNVKLNFAENLLRFGKEDSELKDHEAIASISEARVDKRWTFSELRQDCSRVRAGLEKLVGIDETCAVGAYMPNIGETIVAMLGTVSTGALWSSCSDDFGPMAVSDRFRQIEPKVLFTVNGVISKGIKTEMTKKVEELVDRLPSVEYVIVVDLIGGQFQWSSEEMRKKVVSWQNLLELGSKDDGSSPESLFTKVPFSHPQFVLYSSGTTGQPKSIAHGAGNVLLTHAKELILHSDLRPSDKMLFFTSCGWMMWNWMASALFCGATIIAFDGFAAFPRLSSPWELVEKEHVTHFGTNPRYLQACRKRVRPGREVDLSTLRMIFSTGSPLMPEDFDYVYNHVKSDLIMASISGGTDICSCFFLGNPMLPVRKNELQAAGLGLDVCAYENDAVVGKKAELVCRSPFASAPVCFWGDDAAKSRYRETYFRQHQPGVWYHGDLVENTGSVGSCGGYTIHGRSDTTLKPGGVRIGTAEIYRFAESIDIVEDSLVIGDRVSEGRRVGDINVILFVALKEEATLSSEIENKIRSAIRMGASPAHVPHIIKQVTAIPYTKSGKKVESTIRDLFQGVEPKNAGALVTSSVLDEYREIARRGLYAG